MSYLFGFLNLLAQGESSKPGPDVRDVSWWLDSGAHALGLSRDAFWIAVLTLNLLALAWFLHKMLFRGKDWSVGASLRDRAAGIQDRIREAEAAHRDAEARLRAVEARLSGLPAEIEALKTQAAAEAEAEYARLVEESRREAERIGLASRHEIDAAAKLAQRDLHAFAARLALEIAERRIRERLTPQLDQAVVRQAIEGLQ